MIRDISPGNSLATGCESQSQRKGRNPRRAFFDAPFPSFHRERYSALTPTRYRESNDVISAGLVEIDPERLRVVRSPPCLLSVANDTDQADSFRFESTCIGCERKPRRECPELPTLIDAEFSRQLWVFPLKECLCEVKSEVRPQIREELVENATGIEPELARGPPVVKEKYSVAPSSYWSVVFHSREDRQLCPCTPSRSSSNVFSRVGSKRIATDRNGSLRVVPAEKVVSCVFTVIGVDWTDMMASPFSGLFRLFHGRLTRAVEYTMLESELNDKYVLSHMSRLEVGINATVDILLSTENLDDLNIARVILARFWKQANYLGSLSATLRGCTDKGGKEGSAALGEKIHELIRMPGEGEFEDDSGLGWHWGLNYFITVTIPCLAGFTCCCWCCCCALCHRRSYAYREIRFFNYVVVSYPPGWEIIMPRSMLEKDE
ncbi:unnamed protein product [Darwinula stevensoni]|uniref:Uncharacterized protein n=1 Tax=Darwinula stevensoni TaxID=69355 RepID=A0A7R9A3L0_9CRUS|nr:unnamed protein product [Darwinula stevensoni]CAG0881529.1 unnamed protein product [Darwinula stevensoni]